MKYLYYALFLIGTTSNVLAQNDLVSMANGRFNEDFLYGSASMLFGDVNEKDEVSFLEFGYNKSKYVLGHHYGGAWKEFGLQLGLRSGNPIVAPRASFALSMGVFMIAADAMLFADFNKMSPVIGMRGGIGGHIGSLTIGAILPGNNYAVPGLEVARVSFTYAFKSLKKEKIELN